MQRPLFDGGSVDIIREYSNRFAYWTSEPDRGQSDALNKGLGRAAGDWLEWQNSDDIHCPGAVASTDDMATIDPEDWR